MSLDGDVRFWDSIGIGLAGGDHFVTSSLELGSGEKVTNIIRSNVRQKIRLPWDIADLLD